MIITTNVCLSNNQVEDWQTKLSVCFVFLQCGSQVSFEIVEEIKIHFHQAVDLYPIIPQNLSIYLFILCIQLYIILEDAVIFFQSAFYI